MFEKYVYLTLIEGGQVVSRYRDAQPQMVENYSYLFNLGPYIYKS